MSKLKGLINSNLKAGSNGIQRTGLGDVAVFEIQLLPNVQKPNRIK